MKKEEKIVIKTIGCGVIQNIRIIDIDNRPYLTRNDHCLEIAISEKDISNITTLLERKEDLISDYVVKKYSETKNHYNYFKSFLYDIKNAKNQRKEHNVFLEEISRLTIFYSSIDARDSSMVRDLNELHSLAKKNPEMAKNNFVNAVKKKYYNESIEMTRKTINDFLNTESGITSIRKAMNYIKNATCSDDLENVSSIIINEAIRNKSIDNKVAENIKSFFEYDPLFVSSVITKSVITEYCSDLVDQMSKKDIINLEVEKVAGNINDGDALLSVDPNFDITSMGNGVFNLTKNIFNAKLDKEFDKNQEVLCWDCSNGYVSKCSKIADVGFGSIEDYDFITEGTQVLQGNKVKSFSVTRCQNFELCDGKPKLSKEEFKKAKESLMLYFYDTDDIDIARKRRSARKQKIR